MFLYLTSVGNTHVPANSRPFLWRPRGQQVLLNLHPTLQSLLEKFLQLSQYFLCEFQWYFYKGCCININNKNVPLRERKRHTARRVASARYAGRGGTPSSHDGGYPIQSWWGGVTLSQVGGGTPSQVWGGGYPIQSWWGGGYPIQSWWVGTPSQVSVGYPISGLGGYPIQSWWGGIPGVPSPPPSRPGQGVYPPVETWNGVPPPIQTWDGVPLRPEMGYPPPQTWDEVPPPSRPEMGYLPRPEMGYPPQT